MPTSTFKIGALPAIRTSLTPAAQEIIQKNHAVHNIFFGKHRFHNHLPHHVVSNVALGCEKLKHCEFEHLWKVYDGYLDKKPAPDDSVEINASNWRTYLGKQRCYANYLEFFEQQIQRDGILDVIRKYALDPSVIPYLVSGAVHPLIHVGFAVDAMDSRIASEGLAEACVHDPMMKPVIDLLEPPEPTAPAVQILGVLKSIRADRKFDSAVRFDDENKSESMIRNAILLKPYVNQWSVRETEQDVRDMMKELTEAATMMLFASSRPGHPKSPVLDFFLMHVVTSSLSVRQLVPHLTAAESATLLRAHYATLLMYYGARGRPPLDRSYVLNYPASRSWDELIYDALGHDDAHVPKVIRTMKVAEADWGEMDGLWIGGAHMVIDVLVKNGGDWSFDGMFDEIWGNLGLVNASLL